ncbi:SagB family peptide dehydrogenase [Parasphingorhabdus pacifica]
MQFDSAPRTRLWSLREDVLVESGSEDGELLVVTRWDEIRLPRPEPRVRDWLYRMTLGPVSLANVLSCDRPEEHPSYPHLERVLARLSSCVVHSLRLDTDTGPLLSAVPIARQASFALTPLDTSDVVRLSRFAAIRADGGELVVESALTNYRAVLHRELASRIAMSLPTARTVEDIGIALRTPPSLVAEVLSYLVAAGMVVVGERSAPPGGAAFGEDTDPGLLSWSHHDLLFHSRSRIGHHDGPVGAVYPVIDELPPAPALKPAPAGERFPLYTPRLAEVAAGDLSLTEAVENRRSFHRFASRQLSADQLGELLYRTARVRAVEDGPGRDVVPYATTDRPYPSTGGAHELELYLTLDDCPGLPRGIYHYEPHAHALTLINTSEPHVTALLDGARIATGAPRHPSVLVSVTARMRRLSWIYSGIAYATALTHVGVLQQTFYLVTTAMGLAPCAVATADVDIAVDAFELDWPAEVGVGDFVVGVRP